MTGIDNVKKYESAIVEWFQEGLNGSYPPPFKLNNIILSEDLGDNQMLFTTNLISDYPTSFNEDLFFFEVGYDDSDDAYDVKLLLGDDTTYITDSRELSEYLYMLLCDDLIRKIDKLTIM